MNILAITQKTYGYEVKGVPSPTPHPQSEFLVDGVGLGEVFNFEKDRPWFGQTRFESSPDARKQYVSELRGLCESDNQFGTHRFVLYGCHCGCDYCGILSCQIERTGNLVYWRDVRYEDDSKSDVSDMGSQQIAELAFDADQYDQVIIQYNDSIAAI